MSITAFLDDALQGIADSFAPLRSGLGDVERFRALILDFGWELDPAVDAARFATIRQIFAAEIAILETLAGASGSALAASIPALVASILANRTPDSAWPTPLNTAAFWSSPEGASFPRELVDALLYDCVADLLPVAFGVLRFIGVFKEEDRPAVPASGGMPARVAYVCRAIAWDRLSAAVAHPESVFANVYHWDTAGASFEHARLLGNVAALFEGFPLGVAVVPCADAVYARYFDPIATSPALLDQLTVIPLSYQSSTGPSFGKMKLSLNAMPIPAMGSRTGDPVGIVLFPLATGKLQNEVTLSDGITATLRGDYATSPILAEIRPAGVTIDVPKGGDGVLSGEARVDARAVTAPWRLIGSARTTRLELSQAHLSVVVGGTVIEPELTIEVGMDGATVVIEFGEGDSFLQRMLGAASQRADFSLAVAWSSAAGFHVSGQRRLEVTIPTHQTIANVFTLDAIFVALRTDADEHLLLEAAVSGRCGLGPITVGVDRVGLEARFKPTPRGTGTLGIIDLDLGFRPPEGAALIIDAGAVVGGGYLFFDEINHQYAGVLQLEVHGGIALKAIGLLTTRLPGGVPGFSLLVIISGEFAPIQLGFGFTLNGVGGLFGVNRTMNVDALRTGIKAHTLDSILFPQNPVANAQQIISDLQTVFPPVPERYVFGPMAKLAWGTPTLLTLDLAIVLELPSPVRLAIMGQLRMILPDEKTALVVVRMDVLGIIDFEKSDLTIDATLYDSRVAMFAISGDMAMRLNWGPAPTFLLSAGGLNPRFPAPAQFPSLERLAISLAAGDNPRLRLEAYLALTSNTVQFGAHLDLYAQAKTFAGTFSVSGHFGFDALVQFAPFHFIVDLEAGVALKRDGQVLCAIHLNVTLSGPQPWHASGQATFVFIVKLHIPFSVTIGEPAEEEALPIVRPLLELQRALREPRNWTAHLPDGHMHVTLREVTAASGILVHPLGSLSVRQTVVPLKVEISRFGNARPDASGPFAITSVWVGDRERRDAELIELRDYFAPGQFFEMSDDEKLSAPAFQSLTSGVRLDTALISHGPAVRRKIAYDEVVVDQKRTESVEKFEFTPDLLVALTTGGAAAWSAMRDTGSARFAGPQQRIALRDVEFAIAGRGDLKTAQGEHVVRPTGPSYMEAQEGRRRTAARGGDVQVIPRHEIVD